MTGNSDRPQPTSQHVVTLPMKGLKPRTDEELMAEREGQETTAAYVKTLEEMIYATSLIEACKKKGCLPHRTFHRVKNRSREAWNLYVRARASGADERFDNLLERLDGISDSHRARVMLDAEKWVISKMNRGLYGDDPVTLQGPGGGPVQVESTRSPALEEIMRRLERKRAALLGGRFRKKEKGRGGWGASDACREQALWPPGSAARAGPVRSSVDPQRS
jgi:Bacteriophage Sf6, terminase small subunit-like